MDLIPQPVGVRPLTTPDTTDFVWDPAHVCVIVSENHTLADVLARQLIERGWRVVVAAPSAVGTESWPDAGRVAACIDIHSPGSAVPGDMLTDADAEARVRMSFLLARQLSPVLNASDLSGAWFVTVTQMDGRLGLDARSAGLVSAGAIGLTKTLRQEWPTVFCRAVDLHPELEPEEAARAVIAELFDADSSLMEVGHGPHGRCTLAACERNEAARA